MIKIVSKRSKQENILKKYPNAIIADVTSQANDGLVKLSPFYPHGGIPVPFSDGMTATCVEAVWQGLQARVKQSFYWTITLVVMLMTCQSHFHMRS